MSTGSVSRDGGDPRASLYRRDPAAPRIQIASYTKRRPPQPAPPASCPDEGPRYSEFFAAGTAGEANAN